MRQNPLSCYKSNLLPFQKPGGSLPFKAHPWPLAGLPPHMPYSHPQSGELVRAPNPGSSSSSSRFPARLPPILWPSQSQLPKITQYLGVLCPGRCCCLVWGQGDSPEEDTGGGLVGVLASGCKTGNGWLADRERVEGRTCGLGVGGDCLHSRRAGIGGSGYLGIWLHLEPNPHWTPSLWPRVQSVMTWNRFEKENGATTRHKGLKMVPRTYK